VNGAFVVLALVGAHKERAGGDEDELRLGDRVRSGIGEGGHGENFRLAYGGLRALGAFIVEEKTRKTLNRGGRRELPRRSPRKAF
jgi:hypothetical protein